MWTLSRLRPLMGRSAKYYIHHTNFWIPILYLPCLLVLKCSLFLIIYHHFHPVSSTFIHFHPFSFTFIHFHPLCLSLNHLECTWLYLALPWSVLDHHEPVLNAQTFKRIGLVWMGWMDLWMLVCYNVNPLCSDWNGLSELVVVVVWLVVRSPLQCKWGQMSKWDERRCKASLPPPPPTYNTTSTAVSPPPQSNITNTNSYFLDLDNL